VEVKLVAHPMAVPTNSMCCAVPARGEKKEAAMINWHVNACAPNWTRRTLHSRKRPAREPGVIERRIGRWLGAFPRRNG